MEPKNKRQSKKLPDEAFLGAMACGATVENAATKAGISKSKAFRRLKDTAFQQRLADLKREILKRATAMLTASNLEAVKTLVELLNPSIPPAGRLGAAKAILFLATRLRESSDFEERLAALEKILPTQ
jgi:hypothetical protein